MLINFWYRHREYLRINFQLFKNKEKVMLLCVTFQPVENWLVTFISDLLNRLSGKSYEPECFLCRVFTCFRKVLNLSLHLFRKCVRAVGSVSFPTHSHWKLASLTTDCCCQPVRVLAQGHCDSCWQDLLAYTSKTINGLMLNLIYFVELRWLLHMLYLSDFAWYFYYSTEK